MGKDIKFADYPNIPLSEAQNYFNILSLLLSFLNGGYIGPLLIEGIFYGSDTEKRFKPNALVFAPKITPLELTGTSWCTDDSDLPVYLSCFQTLRGMLAQPPWDETFGLVLSWYFQATQPEIMFAEKTWQIVANALGTCLERLAYTILVLEEKDSAQRREVELLFSTKDTGKAKKEWGLTAISTSVKRLQLLLERIGISLDRGFWDINEVKDFIDIRNEATHPKKGNIDQEQIFHILDQATQWVYEVMLWRLGYTGNYLIRVAPGRQSIENRYDLSTRNPEW